MNDPLELRKSFGQIKQECEQHSNKEVALNYMKEYKMYKMNGAAEKKSGEFIDTISNFISNKNIVEYIFIICLQYEHGVVNFGFFFHKINEILLHHTTRGVSHALINSCTSFFSVFIKRLQLILKEIYQNERSLFYHFLTWAMIFEHFKLLPWKNVLMITALYVKSKSGDLEEIFMKAYNTAIKIGK